MQLDDYKWVAESKLSRFRCDPMRCEARRAGLPVLATLQRKMMVITSARGESKVTLLDERHQTVTTKRQM